MHSVVDLHMYLTNGCKNILCTLVLQPRNYKRINCKQILLLGHVTLPSIGTTMNFVMMHVALGSSINVMLVKGIAFDNQ